MNKKPLILVTNDDGMFAPGLRALVEVARNLGEVVVVAPDSPQSGQGHAVTLSEPIRINAVDVFPEIDAYECSGTPVDCVKLAKHIVLKDRKIDLCISGINHGSNASVNILYSGTMSAAMEAALEGIKSIGFSLLDFSYTADFAPSQPYIKTLMKFVLNGGMQKGHLFNVNIPKLPLEEIRGIKVCRQAHGRWIEEFVEGTDPRGEKYYWLTGKFEVNDQGSDHDIWALENGYVSVVPSIHDLTNHAELDHLRQALETIKTPAS
ncbi:MAG: 5'/3'-nucleotidase SurE [Bacteroidetes bacterium]|nr:MAG: 5'/3'-nucleotidase SurE [Bacteroidota bacterium]